MLKTPVLKTPDIHGIVVLPLDGPLFTGDDIQKVCTIHMPPGTLANRSYFLCYELGISVGRDGGVSVCNHGMDIDPIEAISCFFSYNLVGINAPKIVTAHILPAGKYDPKFLQIDWDQLYRFEIFGKTGHIKVDGVNTYMHGGVMGAEIELMTFKKPVLMLVAKGLKDCRTK